MKINGFELNYNQEELQNKIQNQMREVTLIGKDSCEYKNLSDADKHALEHLFAAAKIIDDVALEQDNPFNLSQKAALQEAASESKTAEYALQIFNSLGGVAGSNGFDEKPIELFKNIKMYDGCNFYPIDLSVDEFHRILHQMLDEQKYEQLRKILSARTMVRRQDNELIGIDYTEFFATRFSQIANELECAAHYSTDALFKEYLQWQAQALLQNNEEMDILADKHWAKMQNSPLEFTISRENYDDKITPSIFSNPNLLQRLGKHNIHPVPKDKLGARVGIVNKEGTELLLKFKNEMTNISALMPRAAEYKQSIQNSDQIKQTMVDVDLIALTGDYAECRGGITTAQNLPNNDKPALAHGGSRRNVYHRQVRASVDKQKQQQLLDGLVDSDLHKYYDEESRHLFVIGHENGHSLGPDSSYQTALGIYQHIIEEHKANIISAAMMVQYVKAGIISAEELKKIYTTWVVRDLLLTNFPADNEAHRVADLIEYNYLHNCQAIFFDNQHKLHIDFAKMQHYTFKMLENIIDVQLSKSTDVAAEYVKKWSDWGEDAKFVSKFKINLGVRPYIKIVTLF